MGLVFTLFRRELSSFFATPVAYVFITIFLILSAVFTFLSVVFTNVGKLIYCPFSIFTHGFICFLCLPLQCERGQKSGKAAPSNY